jgi:hypothetical protein
MDQKSKSTKIKIQLELFVCQFKIFYYRVHALKRILKILATIALILILSISFLPSNYKSQFLVDFAARLSYAYITSLLFYFIVVHIPKEEKKQALTIIIRNRVFRIHHHIRDYYRFILKSGGIEINASNSMDKDLIGEKKFEELCRRFELRNGFGIQLYHHYCQFQSHFDCYRYIGQNIKQDISQILQFYDLVSPKFLEKLNRIQEDFSRAPFDGTPIGNTSLADISAMIYHLMENANALMGEAVNFKKKLWEELQEEQKIKNFKSSINGN